MRILILFLMVVCEAFGQEAAPTAAGTLSPDGTFGVRLVKGAMQAAGQDGRFELYRVATQTPLVVLVPSTMGTQGAGAIWSPDSRIVVVDQDFTRASVITAAVSQDDGKTWIAIRNPELEALVKLAGDRLKDAKSEREQPVRWISSDRLAMSYALTHRDGRRERFSFVLRFSGLKADVIDWKQVE